MKSAPFEYFRPRSVAEALELLARHGDDAKLIAGGQSLVPMMNLRLAAPRVLIDVNEIGGLRYRTVNESKDTLSVGALARHAEFERPVAQVPFAIGEALTSAARFIGHVSIRVRGTFCGSLAHADPAAEWCVIALAAGATLVVDRAGGGRELPVDGFFQGFLTTSLTPDEMIREVRIPIASRSLAFAEISRRHGDFAIVAASAGASIGAGGRFDTVRVAAGGVATTPVRLPRTESLLRDEAPTAELLLEASATAANEVEPAGDIHASADQRRAMTRRLVATVLKGCANPQGTR